MGIDSGLKVKYLLESLRKKLSRGLKVNLKLPYSSLPVKIAQTNDRQNHSLRYKSVDLK